ncbi:MAG: hypothetical protein HQ534_01180 [Armatimonadetes bacterium]|nr:hypothetical protein [Armatimonadota bacterium]
MKKKYFLLLPIILSLISCGSIYEPEGTSEEWIAIIDIDGSNLEYICKSEGAIPYFVPDFENPSEEIVLLDSQIKIDLMNQDGSNRRTIIDSVGTVFNFSHDKTKMLLNREGEIYIANVDGTEFQNLTNTPDTCESDPSFSPDDQLVIYCYTNIIDSARVIAYRHLETNQVIKIIEEVYSEWMNFKSPIFVNTSSIYFGQNDPDTLNSDGLYYASSDGTSKTLIENGYIHSRISFSSSGNKVAYRNSYLLKIYDITNDELIDLAEHAWSSKPIFNNDGSLLSIGPLIYFTDTYENYNILHNYSLEEVCYTYHSIDFNSSSSKVIMNVDRKYP